MVQFIKKTFSKLGNVAMVAIITMFVASVMTVQAQRNSFTNSYLKLRQPKEGEEIMFEKLGKKEIKKLLATPEPEGQSDKERQEYLRGKAILKSAKQISFVIDMEEQDGLLSASIVNDLLKPYEEFISINAEDTRVLFGGSLKKDKIKETIVFVGDKEDNGLMFVNILFKKPIALPDMEGDISQLFSFNSSNEENDNALIKVKYSKSRTEPTLPGFDNMIPFTLEVVQVAGKYGVSATPEPWGGEYLIKPTYEIEPVIYGNNPGNTYIMTFSHDYCYLYDKFGFTVAHGNELSPVYVLGDEEEVAAFIIRSDSGYSLYECPETYALKREVNSLRPHIERRILNCQSLVPTEDGQLKCVKADGSIEFIPIRSGIRKFHALLH
jgi:hypothetical protein